MRQCFKAVEPHVLVQLEALTLMLLQHGLELDLLCTNQQVAVSTHDNELLVRCDVRLTNWAHIESRCRAVQR
jgi:hypothetical protein